MQRLQSLYIIDANLRSYWRLQILESAEGNEVKLHSSRGAGKSWTDDLAASGFCKCWEWPLCHDPLRIFPCFSICFSQFVVSVCRFVFLILFNFHGDLFGSTFTVTFLGQPYHLSTSIYFQFRWHRSFNKFIFLLTRYTCTFLFYGTTRYLPTIGYQRKKGRYTDHGGIIDSGVFLRPTSTIGRLGTVRGYQFKGKVPFGHPGLPFWAI